jgi:hypothetical protein
MILEHGESQTFKPFNREGQNEKFRANLCRNCSTNLPPFARKAFPDSAP